MYATKRLHTFVSNDFELGQTIHVLKVRLFSLQIVFLMLAHIVIKQAKMSGKLAAVSKKSEKLWKINKKKHLRKEKKGNMCEKKKGKVFRKKK